MVHEIKRLRVQIYESQTSKDGRHSLGFGGRLGYWPCLNAPYVHFAFAKWRFDFWYGLPGYRNPPRIKWSLPAQSREVLSVTGDDGLSKKLAPAQGEVVTCPHVPPCRRIMCVPRCVWIREMSVSWKRRVDELMLKAQAASPPEPPSAVPSPSDPSENLPESR